MIFVRSLLFNVAFISATACISVIGTLLIVAPRGAMRRIQTLWGQVSLTLLRWIVGTNHEILGKENLPGQPAVFICKHQSAWDTLIFFLFGPNNIYVVKEELVKIPVFGWCVSRAGSISVDRNAGMSALRKLVADTQARVDEGLNVVVFPEGTRSQVGSAGTYQPGIAAIYKSVDAPIIPVALNSGVFWSRRSFLKYPGTILMEILPEIPKGLDRRAFMKEIESRIESHTRALEDASAHSTAH